MAQLTYHRMADAQVRARWRAKLPKAFTGYRLKDTLLGYLFISPFVVVIGVFWFYAAVYAFYLSFHEFDMFSPPRFVGLENYAKVLKEPQFAKALWNVTLYTLGVVPAQTALALFLAVLVNRKLRGIAIFRTLFYLPSVVSSVAASLIFVWLYYKQGLVNFFLSLIGIHSDIAWLENPYTALPAIMVVAIWATSAHFMVIFLAALQDIPNSVYEAASIDGASGWQAFWRITLPLLRPSIFVVVVLGVIGCYLVFDQIYVMTKGGPMDSTLTVVYLIYTAAFQDFEMGYASAMAFLLFIIVFLLTILQRRIIDTQVQY